MRTTARHQFVSPRGASLAAIVESPESDVRGTIVMAHCFTCSKDLKSMVRLSRRLVELGWQVCRFDFTGIGQSSGDFAATNFDTNIEDLATVIASLAQIDIAIDFLFGHSFGGATSILLANEHRSRLTKSMRGVITLAAPSDTSHLADILEHMNPEIMTVGRGTVEIGGKPFTIDRQMLENFRATKYADRLLASRSTSDHLVSHLLIQSMVDQTVGVEHAYELHRLLSEPTVKQLDTSLYLLPKADHLLMTNAADIEHVAGVIDGWCEQRMGGRFSDGKYN
jgi:uncharacterized protein